MKIYQNIKLLSVIVLAMLAITGCKKEETYPPIIDYTYITSTAITGSSGAAQTTITNSASGKVSVSPATARVYLNTPKTTDVVITYTLSGTAVAGTNYTAPAPLSVTIPAGKWYGDIAIPVINTPLVGGNKTIIITLANGTNNIQIGVGTDRNYKNFTYTLTN